MLSYEVCQDDNLEEKYQKIAIYKVLPLCINVRLLTIMILRTGRMPVPQDGIRNRQDACFTRWDCNIN